MSNQTVSVHAVIKLWYWVFSYLMRKKYYGNGHVASNRRKRVTETGIPKKDSTLPLHHKRASQLVEIFDSDQQQILSKSQLLKYNFMDAQVMFVGIFICFFETIPLRDPRLACSVCLLPPYPSGLCKTQIYTTQIFFTKPVIGRFISDLRPGTTHVTSNCVARFDRPPFVSHQEFTTAIAH